MFGWLLETEFLLNSFWLSTRTTLSHQQHGELTAEPRIEVIIWGVFAVTIRILVKSSKIKPNCHCFCFFPLSNYSVLNWVKMCCQRTKGDAPSINTLKFSEEQKLFEGGGGGGKNKNQDKKKIGFFIWWSFHS